MIARMIWWESEIVLCKVEQSIEVEDVLLYQVGVHWTLLMNAGVNIRVTVNTI